jgi:hypothetical protein
MLVLGSWSTVSEEGSSVHSIAGLEKISKGILRSFACATGLRVQTASAMQASINFEIRNVPADDTTAASG